VAPGSNENAYVPAAKGASKGARGSLARTRPLELAAEVGAGNAMRKSSDHFTMGQEKRIGIEI